MTETMPDPTPTPRDERVEAALSAVDYLESLIGRIMQQRPVRDLAEALGNARYQIRALAAADAAAPSGWQPVNHELSVWCYEQPRLWLWHRLWLRGVTLGYYHEPTDQWRGVDEFGEWFAVGIPPSHYTEIAVPTPPHPAPAAQQDGEAGR